MLITFLVFASVVSLALLVFITWNWKSASRPSSVPGLDKVNDEVGNFPQIAEAGNFNQFLVDLHQKFGPIASFWYGKHYTVSLAGTEVFRQITSLFDRSGVLFEFAVPLISRQSIQFLNGPEGRTRHKLYSEAFSHRSCVQTMPKLNQITKDLVARLAADDPDTHVPLHESMMELAVRMITQCHFGAAFQDKEGEAASSKLNKDYSKIANDMDDMLSGGLTKDSDPERFASVQEGMEHFRSTVLAFVEKHKEKRDAGDYETAPFLNTLLDHAGHDPKVLLADAISLMLGGFHTTGNFMTWTLHYLSLYPDIQEKVFAELSEVFPEPEAEVDEADMKKLVYLNAVLDETLRLSRTGVFSSRVSRQEMMVGGHLIPANTPFINSIGTISMDEKYYPQSERFDPDRFLPSEVQKRPGLAFIPFGFGQRKCPGYKFSLFEGLIMTVHVVRKFKILPASKDNYHIEPNFGFVTKPEKEVWVKLEKRQ